MSVHLGHYLIHPVVGRSYKFGRWHMIYDSAEAPEVHFAGVLRGRGEVQGGRCPSASVDRFILTRQRYDPAAAWQLELYADGEALDATPYSTAFDRFFHPGSQLPRLVGVTDHGVPLEVPYFRYTRTERERLVGTAEEVVLQPDALAWKPASQSVIVDLSQTPLALPETGSLHLSYTGEATAGSEAHRPTPRKIPTALGEMLFALHYHYEEAVVAGVESQVRIPVPTLYFSISGGDTWEDPRELATEVQTSIYPFLRLLSFLSRHHVTWTRIFIRSRPGENERTSAIPSELERIRGWPFDTTPPERGLVNPRRMSEEDLGTLAQALDNSPLRESLLRAIQYTVAARHARYVELSMVNAFTALEALTSGFARQEGHERILGSGTFRSVKRALKRTLGDVLEGRDVRADSLALMTRKLPALNRPAISDNIVRLIEHYDIPWNDIWFPRTELRDAIRALYSVRSRFLHEAEVERPLATRVAGQRAALLTERAVYRILGGEADWLDPLGREEQDIMAADTILKGKPISAGS